jgi:hypothetical protein
MRGTQRLVQYGRHEVFRAQPGEGGIERQLIEQVHAQRPQRRGAFLGQGKSEGRVVRPE